MALARKDKTDKEHLNVFEGTTVLRWAGNRSGLILESI